MLARQGAETNFIGLETGVGYSRFAIMLVVDQFFQVKRLNRSPLTRHNSPTKNDGPVNF